MVERIRSDRWKPGRNERTKPVEDVEAGWFFFIDAGGGVAKKKRREKDDGVAPEMKKDALFRHFCQWRLFGHSLNSICSAAAANDHLTMVQNILLSDSISHFSTSTAVSELASEHGYE